MPLERQASAQRQPSEGQGLMPKPSLIPEQAILETELIETMRAGLHNWRADLDYPQSDSDMQGCVRAVMVMFDVRRRPLPGQLFSTCSNCGGIGHVPIDGDPSTRRTCTECEHGRVRVQP
jgi:hypothetical protein